MNEYLTAIVYGIVQGITEFLPVSSSGHLALIPYFTGASDPGVLFDLAMHVGTALAVIISFRSELKRLAKETLCLRSPAKSPFAFNFWLATFVTIIVVFLIKDHAEQFGRNPVLIAINLIFFGALMWLADMKGKIGVDLKNKMDWKRSIVIGLAQALAVFPGVSRSGATLTAGRSFGLSRHNAGSFSFLLSLPIILGGFFYKSLALYSSGGVPAFGWGQLALGIFMAFIVGLVTIKFFMSMLDRFGLGVYFWYRLILAIIVLSFKNKV